MDAELFWNKIKQRLSEIDKKQTWLCEKIGVNVQSFRDQMSKHRLPTLDVTLKILDAIGLSWEDFSSYPDMKKDEKQKMIPIINQAFSAGNGQFLQDTDEIQEYISVPKELKRFGNALSGAYVRGDSMEPTFSDGDRFICDTHGYDGEDGIYAIHYQGKSYIKRIQKIYNVGIKVISDNPKYEPFIVTKDADDFSVIGRVHCVLHMV